VALAQAVGTSTVVTHLPFRLYGFLGHWHAYRPRAFFLPVVLPRREPYYHFLRNGPAELEAETGVTVAVENMPLRRFLNLPLNTYWFNSPAELARFPHLTLDTTHLGTWGLDPLAVYERLRERVVHVHLSNYGSVDGGRPQEHRSPPDGHLPLADLLGSLARDGYGGAITVETDPAALDAEDEQRCVVALRRALAFCRSHFDR
jgi:sugar phosphate isomerase/epimerase